MTRAELIRWATSNGWTLDRFGHLKRELDNKTYRLRLSRIAARYEIKTPSGWTRIRSGHYKDLHITADGKLGGLTR